MNEAIHRASPVYSQMGYIGTGLALCQLYRIRLYTGLALCKNIRSPAIHRASPVYSRCAYTFAQFTFV